MLLVPPPGFLRPCAARAKGGAPAAAERRADDHALFERFAHTRSPAARMALVERFLPLGHYRARRYRSAEDARDAPDGHRLARHLTRPGAARDDEAGTLGDGIAVDGFVGAEDAVLLEDLMRVLPERERIVVVLRFRDDLLHTEIAERVGVSQMQVSRIRPQWHRQPAGRGGVRRASARVLSAPVTPVRLRCRGGDHSRARDRSG